MIRVKGLEDKNIIESKTLKKHIYLMISDIDGSIVSSGCDHIVNGNFNKWIEKTDFDIAYFKKKLRVNNGSSYFKKKN